MPGEQTPKYRRRLARTFLGAIVAILVLEGSVILVERYLRSIEQKHRQMLSFTETLAVLVERYERATYLAVSALAVSDWELLIAQQRNATRIRQEFIRISKALGVDDAAIKANDAGVDAGPELAAHAPHPHSTTPELHGAMAYWRRLEASQIRLLRAGNHALRDNPDLAEFRAAAVALQERLGRAMDRLRNEYRSELSGLERIHTTMPFVLLLGTLGMALFAYYALVIPLGNTMTELHASRVELVTTALAAGKAEVATNILHNVGNVLNGVNVLAQIARERLHTRQWQALGKAAQLIHENRADLAHFFHHDDKGKRLPDYLVQLAERQEHERVGIIERLDRLCDQIEHIKRIVQLQQAHARSVSLREDTSVAEVIESALDINAPGLERHGIRVIREIETLPSITLDKHKLLQILVNLIGNAKYALADVAREQRRLVIRTSLLKDAGRVRIEVNDNGCGIPPDNLERIFQHGFSTRAEGHGFGLHASSLAAEQLDGTLRGHSDGADQGATFSLELPIDAA